MDDIKPSGSAPRRKPVAPAPQQPKHEEVYEPETPMNEEPQYQEDTKDGMKTWLVVVLVILALVIGAGGVYLWQASSSNSDETAALQSQIDSLNQDLSDAKKAAADSTLEEKNKEIETLNAEVKALTESNTALQGKNAELVKSCQDNGLGADCKPLVP